MKVILSHDIDHISAFEHLTKDTILYKYIVRTHFELLINKISFAEYRSRWKELWKNKWHNVDSIMDYHDELGIKSCFFIGVNNGKGLSYPLKYAQQLIPGILERNYELGVHGIAFDSAAAIKEEYDLFAQLSGQQKFGIRMHYLRTEENTFKNLSESGYVFDSSEVGYKDPYKIGGMWEFPLQLMDTWAINGGKRYQGNDLSQAKAYTLLKIEEAKRAELNYLSILFHDRYFSNSFETWKAWYCWLVEYLQKEGFEFLTYRECINLLENESAG